MKKKLIIVLSILILIILIISVQNKSDKNDDGPTNVNLSFEKMDLNWEEIYELTVQGEEERTLVELKFNGIPLFEERFQIEMNNLKEQKIKSETTGEELEQINQKISNLIQLNEKYDYCKLKEEYSNLKNGDQIEVVCDGAGLEELGYSYNSGYNKTIDGLLPATIVVPEAPMPEVGEEKLYNDLPNNFVVRENDMYVTTASGDYAYVYPKDMTNFTLDEKYKNTKYVIIEISSDDEYDDALEIANRYSNVVAIKNGTRAWTINSDFKEVEGWFGMSE